MVDHIFVSNINLVEEGGKNVTTAVRFGGWENVDMVFGEEDVSMDRVFIMDMIMVSGVGDRRCWPLFFR